VIGHPLGHSISPAVYTAAFAAAGIDAAYDAWDTPEDTLEGRVNALRGADFLGANVTIPHKQAVLPMLDGTSEVAGKAGAVNTIVHQDDGKLIGHNTDVAGFARALKDDAKFDASRKLCVVLGSGGAARAVALALIEAQASSIFVFGRKPRKIDQMVVQLKPLTPSGTTISWAYWGDGSFLRALGNAGLVVNCTPIGTAGSETAGQSPVDVSLLGASTAVFDLVYNPPDTPFVAAAKARGLSAVSGLGMLVYQAAESFRLWTGRDADVVKMLEAGREALGVASPAGKST
jgi:shikimate dehydrogenase